MKDKTYVLADLATILVYDTTVSIADYSAASKLISVIAHILDVDKAEYCKIKHELDKKYNKEFSEEFV